MGNSTQVTYWRFFQLYLPILQHWPCTVLLSCETQIVWENVFINSACLWIRFKGYFKCSHSMFLIWNMSKIVNTCFLKAIFLCSTCEAVWYRWSSFLSRQPVWNRWIRGITEYVLMTVCVHAEKKDTQVQEYLSAAQWFRFITKITQAKKKWNAYRKRLIPIINSQLIIYFSN